ncbi:serine hydrolase domain-containing protein [Streptomyces sp. BBFR102]|uniref:serine hydrolase domain-containing protein n=1 Tax=Streptomyces sp. BBFR102 TaxID=3448171 RepID=UPI003F52A692
MTGTTEHQRRAARGRRRPARFAAAALAAATALGTLTMAPQAAADERATPGHEETQRALDAVVADGVPGALARARDRHGVWNGTAGTADLDTGRARGADDRFRVGSLTKTFVATVLLQLQGEGRLDLDDTVDQHLPGVVTGNGHDGTAITLRQLLNHTSGISNYTADPEFQRVVLGEEFLEHRYDTWTPGQLVTVAMGHAPDFAPGTAWNYSNTNYILAGMVIEETTGRSWEQEVERRILRPLGLSGTSAPGTDPHLPRPAGRAYSHLGDLDQERPHDVTELNPSQADAAGAMISTTADIDRFHRALLGGRLLPAAQLRQMTTTVPVGPSHPEDRYGLGLMWQKLSCGTVVWGHNGGIHGSTTTALTTRDTRHSYQVNLNGDWSPRDPAEAAFLVESEFCGKG